MQSRSHGNSNSGGNGGGHGDGSDDEFTVSRIKLAACVFVYARQTMQHSFFSPRHLIYFNINDIISLDSTAVCLISLCMLACVCVCSLYVFVIPFECTIYNVQRLLGQLGIYVCAYKRQNQQSICGLIFCHFRLLWYIYTAISLMMRIAKVVSTQIHHNNRE